MVLVFLLFVCPAAWSAGPSVITKARDLLSLTENESGQNREIELTGVVTACDPAWTGEFFLQDDTAGVFVDAKGQGGKRPQVGDVVNVKGTSEPGAFAPIVAHPVWTVIGQAPLPAAKPVLIDQVMTGAEDGQRIEISGWVHEVRSVDGRLILDVVAGSDRVYVHLPEGAEIEPGAVVGAQAKIRGVASATSLNFNVRRMVSVELWVTSMSDFEIITPPEPDPLLQPPAPIASLTHYRIDNFPGRRFHLHGVITYRGRGVLYVSDSSGGIEVRATDTSAFEPGDVVNVSGFPIQERGLPILTDATIRSAGTKGAVAPVVLGSFQQLRDGHFHASRISVEGRLINYLERTTGADSSVRNITLALQTGEGIVTAEIENSDVTLEQEGIQTGSRVRVVGVCATMTDRDGAFQGFHVLVPSLADVKVIEPPSMFTRGRLLTALLIVLFGLLVIALWALFLLRKNAALAGDVRERNAVLAERARLAGDLHDTLEQALTGVSLQLKTAARLISTAPDRASDHLGVASEGIRQTHSELRRSIWNLTPEALERFNLAEAISRAVKDIAAASGLQARVRVLGESPVIDPVVQQNLLRIAQEAANNVAKHAGASRIDLRLSFTRDKVSLVICDDGRGLSTKPEARGPSGGFGVIGMRERSGRIGGTFSIENRSSRGTIVRVKVPIAAGMVSERLTSPH